MSKKNFDLCWQVLKQTDPLHKPNRVDLQTAFQNFLQQYDETDHVFQRTQQHSADHGTWYNYSVGVHPRDANASLLDYLQRGTTFSSLRDMHWRTYVAEAGKPRTGTRARDVSKSKVPT